MSDIDITQPEPDDSAGEVARWVTEIRLYERDAQPWEERSRKIVKRYKDQRNNRDESVNRYNILWSNVDTFRPAMFAKNPKIEVQRRWLDKDPVGLEASEVLERAIEFTIGNVFDFKDMMNSIVMDRLLCGRGVMWIRYQPHFRDADVSGNAEVEGEGAQVTDDESQEQAQDFAEPTEVVAYEEAVGDYVHWEDFGHTTARTWDEVKAVWRKVYLDRTELVARFGDEIGNAVPLNYTPRNISGEKIREDQKKAVVYEIWDKPSKTAYWICKDYAAGPLDERLDPLGLDKFFPCPRPLFANLANDTIIPTPDYSQYQDQAHELDELTARIQSITKAIKVAGVYDASAQGVSRLLAEGVENQLIPISSWAMFAEKGGLKGAFELLPVENILQTLVGLHEARDKVKEELYEITGMLDIRRSADDPEETATATKVRSQYSSIRLRERQDEVQRFVRDSVALIGQVISKHFQIDTLREITGVKLLTDQEKQMIQMQQQAQAVLAQHQQQQAQAMQQQGMQPPPVQPPKPLPQDIQDQLTKPSWDQVKALLESNAARQFRMDIETDSTIGDDAQAEQQARLQFAEMAGKLLIEAMQASSQNPAMAPLLGEVLMFVIRSFKTARTLEETFQETIDKLVEKAKQPPAPNPEMVKMQGQQQLEQAKMQAQAQADQVRAQTDIAIAQAKIKGDEQLAQVKAQLDAQVAQAQQAAQERQAEQQMQMELRKHQAEMSVKAQMAQFDAETKARLELARMEHERSIKQMENEANLEKARIAANATIASAEISANASISAAQASAAEETSNGEVPRDEPKADPKVEAHGEMIRVLGESHKVLADHVSSLVTEMRRPKSVQRDKDGKIVGLK